MESATDGKPQTKILIIEDNPDHAMLAKKALEKDGGVKVCTAHTAMEGFGELRKNSYDLILCDYNLPDVSGLELLRQIKEENFATPFVMLTGQGDERIAVSAIQHGAYNYLIKDDIYLHILPRSVNETLSRYHADQERKKLEREVWHKNKLLEEMNAELARLDKLKDEFIASVTHEFRTPLSSVKESIALLIDGVVKPDDPKHKRILEIAANNVTRVAKLVDDLLDFKKLEAGKVHMKMEMHRVAELLEEAVNIVKQLAEKQKVELVIREGKVSDVYCDEYRIVQVLVNLIGNAIKFTPEKGTITLWSEPVLGDKIKVSVQDTGMGIDPKMHLKIFDRFEQVERSMPGSQLKGTGLGLSICRHIIQLHKGSIWVESELGKGSTFMFTLPTKPFSQE